MPSPITWPSTQLFGRGSGQSGSTSNFGAWMALRSCAATSPSTCAAIDASPHPTRVRAHEPVAGVVQVEALEQVGRSSGQHIGIEMGESTDELQVLRAREVLVDRGVLSGEPDRGATRAVSRRVSRPRTWARPSSAGRSVVRMRTAWSSPRRSARGARAPCPAAPRTTRHTALRRHRSASRFRQQGSPGPPRHRAYEPTTTGRARVRDR